MSTSSFGLFFAISFIQSLKLVIWALCICGMSFFKSIINDITLMISKWGTSKYKCQFHNVDGKHLKVVTMKIKSLWITTVSIHNLSLGTQINTPSYTALLSNCFLHNKTLIFLSNVFTKKAHIGRYGWYMKKGFYLSFLYLLLFFLLCLDLEVWVIC